MPDRTPNPQAVETFYKALDSSKEPHEALLAAEPHIRSQLLAELAKTAEGAAKFENSQGRHEGKRAFESVVKHCRRLAAKETSDG